MTVTVITKAQAVALAAKRERVFDNAVILDKIRRSHIDWEIIKPVIAMVDIPRVAEVREE